jgi:hypothetical protein
MSGSRPATKSSDRRFTPGGARRPAPPPPARLAPRPPSRASRHWWAISKRRRGRRSPQQGEQGHERRPRLATAACSGPRANAPAQALIHPRRRNGEQPVASASASHSDASPSDTGARLTVTSGSATWATLRAAGAPACATHPQRDRVRSQKTATLAAQDLSDNYWNCVSLLAACVARSAPCATWITTLSFNYCHSTDSRHGRLFHGSPYSHRHTSQRYGPCCPTGICLGSTSAAPKRNSSGSTEFDGTNDAPAQHERLQLSSLYCYPVL